MTLQFLQTGSLTTRWAVARRSEPAWPAVKRINDNGCVPPLLTGELEGAILVLMVDVQAALMAADVIQRPIAWNSVVPILVMGGAAIAAFTIYRRPGVDQWLSVSAARRRFATLVGVISGGGAGILLAVADFKKFFGGNADAHDAIILSGLGLLSVIPVLSQFLLLRRADTSDAELAESREEVTAAKNSEFFQLLVNRSFLQAVGQKRDSIRAVRNTVGVRVDRPHEQLQRIREGGNPQRQIKILVAIVFDIYRQMLNQTNAKASLRVAYFDYDRCYLRPRYTWDGINGDCTPEVTGRAKERFRVQPKAGRAPSAASCAAVAAASRGEIVIIPDAIVAHDDPSSPFGFFGDAHQTRLRSMVVIPLGAREGNPFHEHVLCIDTDETGFFHESQLEQFRLIKQNLEVRLSCELELERLYHDGVE